MVRQAAGAYGVMRNFEKSILLGVLSIALAMPSLATSADQPQVAPDTIVMSSAEDATTFAGKWLWLIYTEAFKRLGMKFQISMNSVARESVLAEEGSVSGEVSRTMAYGLAHPNLVRVEESVLDMRFALYTANPSIHIQHLDELSSTNLLGEYRRGVLTCETALRKVLPPARISDVTTVEQGILKLLAGRTDVFCDNDVSVVRILHSPDIKGVGAVHELIQFGDVVPTYPYLNRKYASLAPRLATVLKQMKAEGMIETYRIQAQRDMGWIK
jgi:hypothetical protein